MIQKFLNLHNRDISAIFMQKPNKQDTSTRCSVQKSLALTFIIC
jgi:hypothetical protein